MKFIYHHSNILGLTTLTWNNKTKLQASRSNISNVSIIFLPRLWGHTYLSLFTHPCEYLKPKTSPLCRTSARRTLPTHFLPLVGEKLATERCATTTRSYTRRISSYIPAIFCNISAILSYNAPYPSCRDFFVLAHISKHLATWRGRARGTGVRRNEKYQHIRLAKVRA